MSSATDYVVAYYENGSPVVKDYKGPSGYAKPTLDSGNQDFIVVSG
jgi:hypothetical protein